MRLRHLVLVNALIALLAGAPGASAASPDDDPRYALVGGCYGLRSAELGTFVEKAPDGGYRATARGAGTAEGFRMQATELGRYLLYGRARDFLAAPSGALEGREVRAASQPSSAADWWVRTRSGAFELRLGDGRALGVGADGRLTTGDAAALGRRRLFTFEPAQGCSKYPEVEVNATGKPSRGSTPDGEVRGLVDAHMHLMAFEFFGGSAHCGRPWHRYGVTHALVDCPDHYAGAAPLDTFLGGPASHDPVGWPTFRDWPHYDSLTHEGSYYKWLERTWRAGLRLYVNLLTDNAVLCEVYPLKRHGCNEMDSVRLQARRVREFQNYVDAQSGGPGKGWFRVVTDPFEARRVANQGKLAVVLGIEVSKLFDCGLDNEVPECDREQIDRQLEEVHDLGVRSMELVNKFDNALAGVAGDSGTTGVVVNTGNRYETGRYWDMQTCTGHEHEHDRGQLTPHTHNTDALLGNAIRTFAPGGTTPLYPPAPHCNQLGLSDLGEHLVRRMVQKGMIIDPDHLSVRARDQVMALLEAHRYSGVISSHSWSTPSTYPRIYRLGGFITPYAGDSETFVEKWRDLKSMRSGRHFFGFGYGADLGGFGSQGGPRRGPNPVRYPFRSFDGKVTLDRQRSGERVYDINEDGVSHYGLYPDWVEDLRMQAGQEIVDDMARGAEAYLQMWERAVGVPSSAVCRAAYGRFDRRGLGRVRLHKSARGLLRYAGQPVDRTGRSWEYCVQGRRNRDAEVVAVLTPRGRVGLVGSTAARHRIGRVGPGSRVATLDGRARRFGRGVLVRPAGRGGRYVYVVRRGRVRAVAVVARSVGRSPGRLAAYLRRAGLR